MRKTITTLALLATLTSFTTMAHAATTELPASSNISAVITATGVTYNFTALTFSGFEFLQIAGNLSGPVYGTLTSVSVNATLDASIDDTYGDDLTIYVKPGALGSGGLLQVGGYSSLGAAESHSWANGGSPDPGTTVVDTVILSSAITFTGALSDPAIWLGNGYGAAGTEGTWTGSVTLNGLSATAPVPEPSSLALMALGGLGLAVWVARRRRTSAAA